MTVHERGTPVASVTGSATPERKYTPYTLHPTPFTLTPCTLHPTPYTLHPTPYTLHTTPHHTTRPTHHTTPHTLTLLAFSRHAGSLKRPKGRCAPFLTSCATTPPSCKTFFTTPATFSWKSRGTSRPSIRRVGIQSSSRAWKSSWPNSLVSSHNSFARVEKSVEPPLKNSHRCRAKRNPKLVKSVVAELAKLDAKLAG